MTIDWLSTADRLSPWPQAQVVVAGLGAAGFAAADALLEAGAQVRVVDVAESGAVADRAALLERLDAVVELGEAPAARLGGADLVIASPGWHPDAPLFRQAEASGVPIWGDVELAWRLMHPDRVIPWLGVTGTNGKTTTTTMLDAMLRADGRRSAAVGNIGRPVIEALNDPAGYEVLAVELSSFQLHWMSSVALHSAVVLNVHEDHLEWYAGAGDPMAAYTADKGRIYRGVTTSCVYNVAEPLTRQLVEEADVTEGARAIGFTSGIPAIAMIGVVDDLIVDRAFIDRRADSALPLANISDVHPLTPPALADALAAAALARSFGVKATAVATGLRGLEPGRHRVQPVGVVSGVTWVDDSKATNPHAADASLSAFPSVVWLAGGQTKGTHFDDLVAAHRERLRGAVLLGTDRAVIAGALARQAPDVPVVVLDDPTPAVMGQAVAAAAQMARPGDTVLLAPGAASRDIWTGYDARGDDFAAAVKVLPGWLPPNGSQVAKIAEETAPGGTKAGGWR